MQFTKRQLPVMRAVIAVNGGDIDAVKRQLETDGYTAEDAHAALTECVADGTIILNVPPAGDVVQFPGRNGDE